MSHQISNIHIFGFGETHVSSCSHIHILSPDDWASNKYEYYFRTNVRISARWGGKSGNGARPSWVTGGWDESGCKEVLPWGEPGRGSAIMLPAFKKWGGSRSGGQPLVSQRAGVAFLYPPLAVNSFYFEHLRPCDLLQMHLMRWQLCVMKACANKRWRKLGVQ